jgi:hypothetical protein
VQTSRIQEALFWKRNTEIRVQLARFANFRQRKKAGEGVNAHRRARDLAWPTFWPIWAETILTVLVTL